MIEQAILNLNPAASFAVGRSDINEITWLHGTTPIPLEDIQTEVDRLQAEYDAQAYARSRKAEYDQLNQFELISDDSINGTTTHKDAILAIKAKYPKE